MFAALVTVDRFPILEPCDCNAPSKVYSQGRNRPDTRKTLEGRMVMAGSTRQPCRLARTRNDAGRPRLVPSPAPVTANLTAPAPSGTCRTGL